MKISCGSSKSPGAEPFVSPGFDELAVLRKFHDAGGVVLIGRMAIRHEDIAVWRNGNAGRPIECIRTIAGHALLAERHQHLACRTQLEDFLAHDYAFCILGRHAEHCLFIVHVADPQISVSIDGEAVRISEQSHAKALQKLARWIEFQNRRIGIAPPDAGSVAGRHGVEASMKDPDVAVAMDMHPDNFSPVASVHALRKRWPALDEAIRIWEFGWFGVLRLLRLRRGAGQDENESGSTCK